ncbi:MAG: hypothetical protein AAGC55_18010 [Myxococcota bacterium]
MKPDKSWLVAIAVVGVVLFATYRLWPDEPEATTRAPAPKAAAKSPLLNPQRPATPPAPGQRLPRPPEPQPPPLEPDFLANVYRDAIKAGDDRPGEAAFRANVDAFIEYNAKFAEAQARDEGITVDEVRELTFFGFMAMQTQRWPDVEDLIGRELSEDERMTGEELMHETNREFKQAMRALVADGASEDKRWQLIRTTQAEYRRAYFAITGMNDELLDALLAGDLSRDYAPAATDIPDEIAPNDEPVPEPPVRPDSPAGSDAP